MAYSEQPVVVSAVAGATFSTADLYKLVTLTASGEVIISTSSDTFAFGSLYGRTGTTSSTGVQAVPVAVGGVVKVQLAASTLKAGKWIAGSSVGLGVAPTSELAAFGRIVSGSSGAAGRVVSVLVAPVHPTTGSVLAGI
jgi:hypothetical protein